MTLFLVVVLFLGVSIVVYMAFLHPKSAGKANQAAHNLDALSPPLAASFTCGYADFGFCTLTIDSSGVRCEQAGSTLFKLAYDEITEVLTSYWAVRFVTPTTSYAITALHKPQTNQLTGVATRQVVATEPATLREFEQLLSAHNVSFKRKLTLQKHMVVALGCGLLSLLFLIYLVYMKTQ
jgi:hypothetical protein